MLGCDCRGKVLGRVKQATIVIVSEACKLHPDLQGFFAEFEDAGLTVRDHLAYELETTFGRPAPYTSAFGEARCA